MSSTRKDDEEKEKNPTQASQNSDTSDEGKLAPAPRKTLQPTRRLPRRTGAITPYGVRDMWSDFDRMFDDFRDNFEAMLLPWAASAPSGSSFLTRTPAVDLEDKGDEYVLTAEMPGFKKEDIDIQVSDDGIEIKAVAGWKYDEKKDNYICTERRCNSFYRSIELPEQINSDAVKADLKDGLLEITLPKKEPKERRKITLT